jgi:hypothetical protein
MNNFSSFVVVAIIVVCVAAPLVLFGFILRSALGEKPGEAGKKKDAK